MRKTVCLLIVIWLAVPTSPHAAQPNPAPGHTDFSMLPWDEIGRAATGAVGNETPQSVFPFARPSPQAIAASPRKVFAYYFPFFLVSMDNLPVAADHWAVDYMRRTGEGGKYATVGGFTRERQLPIGPWPSPYWREIDEAADVLRARAIGIDGFGVGLQETGWGATASISEGVCNAAAHVAPGFHVFPVPDGDVLKDVSPELMAQTVAAYERCPAAWRMPNGHALVAPFAPERESVGYWRDVLERLRADGMPTDLIPVLLDVGRFAAAFGPISAGMSAWGFSHPEMMTRTSISTMLATIRQPAPLWMHPIKPQDFRPKTAVFWEAGNTHAFRKAWMQAINGGADYVQLISWNDYSEATEIAPSTGTQFLFYDLSAYYIVWFKTGHPPAVLRDAIYYSHRNQIFQPDHPPAPHDQAFQHLGDIPLANDVEMLAMLTQPGTLEISIGRHVYRREAPIGLTSFRVPAEVGRPRFKITRRMSTTVEVTSNWRIEGHPAVASALYLGGSSTRSFQPPPMDAR